MIARIPPKQLGSVHGVRPRLLLHPANKVAPASYTDDDPDDEDLWRIPPADAHICHALYLGSECVPGKAVTVPSSARWPVRASGAN